MYQDLNDLNYSEPLGGWKWVDGTALSYSNWSTCEPNNSGQQHFGTFNYGLLGIWDDNSNDKLYPFIMAIDKSNSSN